MTPITFKDFYEQNEILFSELAFDQNTNVISIACEHFQDYIQSIKDLEND